MAFTNDEQGAILNSLTRSGTGFLSASELQVLENCQHSSSQSREPSVTCFSSDGILPLQAWSLAQAGFSGSVLIQTAG